MPGGGGEVGGGGEEVEGGGIVEVGGGEVAAEVGVGVEEGVVVVVDMTVEEGVGDVE